MSLRRRLLALIILILPLSLLAGGLLSYLYALTVVESELTAALGLAGTTVREATSQISPFGAPEQHLARLVSTFDNDRDVGVNLVAPDGKVLRSSRPMQAVPPAPEWLKRALYAEPIIVDIPLPEAISHLGAIRLEGKADNEIAEVWEEMKLQFAILAGFFALVLWLVSLTLNRALRPLDNLAHALSEVRQGNFSAHVDEKGPEELNIIYREFNRMAQGLQEAEHRNKLLSSQLSAVQEEERKELARDLHDEIGPFLFAVDVDAQTIPQFLERGASGEVVARAGAIRQSIAHMQGHVRAILGRLRPAQLLDLGLDQAIDQLIAFWTRRQPEVEISADIDQASYGHEIDEVAFRIVQESLNNAIRHGAPTRIAIKAHVQSASNPAVLQLSITDNGGGISPASSAGFGIAGMRERAEAVGGTLDVSPNALTSGVAVIAALPLPAGVCLCSAQSSGNKPHTTNNNTEGKGLEI